MSQAQDTVMAYTAKYGIEKISTQLGTPYPIRGTVSTGSNLPEFIGKNVVTLTESGRAAFADLTRERLEAVGVKVLHHKSENLSPPGQRSQHYRSTIVIDAEIFAKVLEDETQKDPTGFPKPSASSGKAPAAPSAPSSSDKEYCAMMKRLGVDLPNCIGGVDIPKTAPLPSPIRPSPKPEKNPSLDI